MDQEAYLSSHPPRCLAGFGVQNAELPGVIFDGHGEESNIVFLISCKCGHDQHYVLGHYWRNPDHDKPATRDKVDALMPNFAERVAERVKRLMMSRLNLTEAEYLQQVQDRPPVFLSPLATRCEACQRVTELIDTDRHGYDAEIGAIVATKRGEGDRVDYLCEECGRKPLRLWARFEYSDDLFDREISEFHEREQELFSWFSLVGQCSGCSRLLSVADFECA
jgi:hypothetical protein